MTKQSFKSLWVYSFLIVGLMLAGCVQDAQKPPLQKPTTLCKLQGKVIKVTDGDTVNVLDADKTTHKIRLAGIDAPELGQAYSQAGLIRTKVRKVPQNLNSACCAFS